MKDLAIKNYPAKVLRGKTAKIKNPLDPEIQEMIPLMLETMQKASGVGLAAPQIGKSVRLCLVSDADKIYVAINPKITSFSKNKILMEEGCLSFPGKFFPIERPEEVKVRFLNEAGKETKLKAKGLVSRAFQHEIDHLDGVLIIDRAKKSKVKKIKNL